MTESMRRNVVSVSEILQVIDEWFTVTSVELPAMLSVRTFPINALILSGVVLPVNVSYNSGISLQCRHILGGRKLVRVRNIVSAAIFYFMRVEDWGE